MEYFYSDDPQEIENEKKKQQCYHNLFPLLMGDKDETTYVLTNNGKNEVNDIEEQPTDKLYSKEQEIYNKAKVLAKEAGFALKNPRAAWGIGPGVIHNSTNISTKATRFATKGKILHGTSDGEEELGSENGAFRHALWQAEIASRYGETAARRAGNAHEIEPGTDLNNRRFNHLANADQTTDLLNNQIGRAIGRNNPKKNSKDLALLLLDEFKNNGLYVSEADEDGFWNVKKRKLSQEKYDSLRNIFSTLDKSGFTQQQLIEFEKKINKDGRIFHELNTPWRTMK